MDFSKQALASRLAGKHIGKEIHFLRETDSTNDTAFSLALRGSPEGTVVIADRQTKGKGRLNRVWQSPPNCNLYTSIILRPETEPISAPQITLMTGVVVAEVLSRYHPAGIGLKWPNDVQIGGKKVCGILTEMKVSDQQNIDFIIVGIGININMTREDFDGSFRKISTSLKEETGRDIPRLDFTATLYNHFEKWYATWIAQGFDPVRNAWLKCSSMVGKRIEVVFYGDVQTGEVIGIDEYGALLLRDKNDARKTVMAGDASILKG